MGIFRLLLALSVLLGHTGGIAGFQPLGGVEAVETFFMISGFYMAMILTEKYRGPGSYRLFLGNRLLRIYPVYWVVAALTVLVWLVYSVTRQGHGPLAVFHKLHVPAALLVSLANVTVIGQDAVMFTGADADGHLRFTANFQDAAVQTWRYLLVPPAWTLALELTFYFIAPFIVRKSAATMLVVIAACLALRAYLFFGLGLHNDPWTYRFFFTEVTFFLAGAIAYKVYLWMKVKPPGRPLMLVAAGTVYAFYFLYQFLPPCTVNGVTLNPWAFFIVAWIAIPVLFLLCKQSVFDRYLGELSYPLYVVHWLVLTCVSPTWVSVGFGPGGRLAAIALSLVAAWLLFRFVSEPVERVRRHRAKSLVIPPTSLAPLLPDERASA